MSASPIKYESKILSNLANMLKLSEKSDKEILSEIKEDNSSIKFEIDEDIKKVLDMDKINCTCEESKKRIEGYTGKKFEYYYNVETYGVDFFLDICSALCRSNYKPFLTEEGKNEIMNGLKIRRNSNLYKYVSFFLSKERLNRDRLNDGKTPENIFHCFKCLKSVLHIYVDDRENSNKKMYLKDKYITEEIEDKIENEILREKGNFQKKEDIREGIISVGKYKSELTSLSRRSNEKIMKDIFEHTKNMKMRKEYSLNKDNIKKSNTFENVNNYKKDDFYDRSQLIKNNDSILSFSNEKIDKRYQSVNKNKKLDSQNKVLKRNSYKKNNNASAYFYDQKKEEKQVTPKNKKNKNDINLFLNKNENNKMCKNNSIYLENSTDKNVRSKMLIKKGNINKTVKKKIEKGNRYKNRTSYELKNNNNSQQKEKSKMHNETVNSIVVSNEVQKNKETDFENYNNSVEIKNDNSSNEMDYHKNIDEIKFNSTTDDINKNEIIADTLENKEILFDEIKKNSIKKEIKINNNTYEIENEKSISESYSNEEEYYYNESDGASYSTDDSSYIKYLKKKKKLQEQGKIVIDLDLLHGNSIISANKQNKEEKLQDKLRIGELKKILEEKKMVFCKIEDIAKKRNKRYVKTQVLSEDSKIERVYFSHKMKKFYNSKSGYFGCGWSNNKMEWTPFIHAPFFDNQHNAIYKNRNKKLYEEIYDTLLHGRIHPDIRIVELKDHKHPVRLCTPHNEDCYSIVYIGKKINATDDRIIFGEYTGFVANNRELSQEKHQYMFALTFSKKVFNDKKNVVFINEIESDEEENDNSTESYINSNTINNEISEKLTNRMNKNVKGKTFCNLNNSQNENSTNSIHKVKRPKVGDLKKSKNLNNLIILPDNYTYAVDSSYMFNEMSLVNHYKTCSIFNNYDFRINAEWQLVYLDGWPHIILTSIPGIEIYPGEEIFADFGFEWFERINDTCLNEFIKNNFEHRLNKLNLSKDKLFNGLDDIVEKYNLLKNNTTCNICMHNVNIDGNNFITCSGCNNIYHLKCVHKLNEEVNENYDWFCSSCIQFSLNLINQKEFLNYIEKKNQKKFINFFSDVHIDNLKKYNKSLYNNTLDKTICVEFQNSDTYNELEGYEKANKLLKSNDNINDIEKNREIVEDLLEKKEIENNLLEIKENEENNLLLNDFELQLLVYYKKKIDELLIIREKIDFFLKNDNYKNTLKRRKGTLSFLTQSKKCIEDFLRINENINNLQKKMKDSNFTKNENEQKLQKKKSNDNLVSNENYKSPKEEKEEKEGKEENTLKKEELPFEKPSNDTSEIDSNFSNTYEKILYKKSNNIVKNLKEMRKKDKNNKGTCCNYMMKLSKKYIGFPLIKDFEKGINTKQPSLPLNDYLKKLSVCSSCYNKHHDLAKAIICRITKMHFHSNYNDCLTDEDLFKSSSECIQSVIRELANTIKEYRKKELDGAYLNIIKNNNSLIENDNMNLEVNFSNVTHKINNNNFGKIKKDDNFFYEKRESLSKENHNTNDKDFKKHLDSSNTGKNENIDNYDDGKKEKHTLHNDLSETVNNKESYKINNFNKFKEDSNTELNRSKNEEYLKNEKNGLYENKKYFQNDINNSSTKNNNDQNKIPENEDLKNETLKNEKFSNINLNNTKEILDKEINHFNSIVNNNKVSNFIPLFGIELGKTKFQREFTNGTFVGTVTKHIKDEDNNNFFVITYEDGDVEWITPCFLFQELLKQSTNNIEYPLASSFKDLFYQDFKKDIKLNNCSLELKIEKKKRKSNCEYNSNNNSVTKRQKQTYEENSSRNKKSIEYDFNVTKRNVNKLKNSEANDSVRKKRK
ncbi:histone-lysine N-methyltransferase, H3 lysine-4 specific, putative [Plasmodium gallinaceum]|uniref:Histone-lysine N-methyltransferase, H3 lysine-4 specific, putative n=1 Tax=Plasmodium gallinaceum TaxID=5849 RepID=A0A1J1GZ84_PLAGA|nr:histone-lysine N-methyltransferase, H3 lysine-4 specific, putative [Plasmodium gallinaceum]CRG97773.1 histone-lysine N-methyltransferase, H3 lysine-4 specific, putative [Plasmodium gallinaceum]